MAHAHPSPSNPFVYNDENSHGTNVSLRPRPLFHHNPTTPTAIEPSRERNHPFSLQNRRLQLRNINFRGSILPSRRLSTQISRWTTAGPRHSDKSDQKENNPELSQRQSPPPVTADDVSPNSGSILKEISNSSRRTRITSRPPIADIFEDPVECDKSLDTPTSWYLESSNQSTPLSFESDVTMKQRDLLPSKSPPPLSSPLAKQIRGRKKSRMNLRSASYEQSKYIEHLEAQLASAQKREDSVNSPSSARGPLGKLRTLTMENNCLRQELTDWETKFTELVQDAVGKKVELESSLRKQIRLLEQDVESKDRKIKDLGWELERASTTLSDMASLESTNRSLERRIDVLTELLAQSPTRPQHPLERSSPFKPKTPRPRSMMPRLPSSIDRMDFHRRDSANFTDLSDKISRSEATSPSRLTAEDDEPQFGLRRMLSEGVVSLDSGIGESCSLNSTATSSSRPVSILSDSSTGPLSWGLPLPGMTSPEIRAIQTNNNKNRKMRKFPSGSSQLKPLILPSTTAAIPIPGSAPVSAHPLSSREVSQASLDPTTSFLSRHSNGPIFDTPILQRRSSTWVQEDTLKALEGKSSPLGLMDSLDSVLSSPDITISNLNHTHNLSDSLQHQLEVVYAPSPASSPMVDQFSFSDSIDKYLVKNGLKAEEQDNVTEEVGSDLYSMDDTSPPFDTSEHLNEVTYTKGLPTQLTEFASITTPPHTPDNNTIRRRHPSPEQDATPVPPKYLPPLARPHSSPIKCQPLVSVASTNVLGSISRYTLYFNEIRRDPTALARRVIANAWCSNWKTLGRLSWWVLGLFLGPSEKEEPASPSASEGFNWDYYSAEASKARRLNLASDSLDDSMPSHGETLDATLAPKKVGFLDSVSVQVRHSQAQRRCKNCVESTSSSLTGRIRLWAKFSFALVLAVGVAVKDGPATLFEDGRTESACKESKSDSSDALSSSDPPTKSEITRGDVNGSPEGQIPKLQWVQNLGVKDFID